MGDFLKNRRGQTSLEYLLLLVAAFITTYIVTTGKIADFTRGTLFKIRSGLRNTVRNGEWKEGDVTLSGQKGHPGDPARHRPIH